MIKIIPTQKVGIEKPKIEPPIEIRQASPPEEPPGVLSLFRGCVVTPNTGFEQAYEFMDCDTLVKLNGMAPNLRIPLIMAPSSGAGTFVLRTNPAVASQPLTK